MPKDVITVLGKRGAADELEHVVEEYFKTPVKSVESPDAHALSSAPPEPDHGPTNVAQAPGPNPASSTANQGLVGPSYEGDEMFHNVPLDGPASSEYGSGHGLTGAHSPLPKLPAGPKPRPSTDSKFDMSMLDPPPAKPALSNPSIKSGFYLKPWINKLDFKNPSPAGPASSNPSIKSGFHLKDWINKLNLKDTSLARPASSKPSTKSGSSWKPWTDKLLNLKDPSPPRPASSKPSSSQPSTESGPNWKYWPNPLNVMDPLTPEARLALSKPSNPKPSTDSDFDWDYWANLKDPPPSGTSSSKSSNPGPSNPGKPNPMAHQPPRPLRIVESPQEPENAVAPGPSPTPGSTNPAESQPADPEAAAAALYAAKGKAKQARRIFGTARDVGDAAEGVAACGKVA